MLLINMLHVNMRDAVYLLVHKCEVNRKKNDGNELGIDSHGNITESEKGLKCEDLNGVSEDMVVEKSGCSGAIWEIFRREEAG